MESEKAKTVVKVCGITADIATGSYLISNNKITSRFDGMTYMNVK